jgi:excisionase family DNA binding protein
METHPKKNEVSVSTAARIVPLARRTILKYIYKGKLPARRMGDAKESPWLIERQALKQYERRVESIIS